MLKILPLSMSQSAIYMLHRCALLLSALIAWHAGNAQEYDYFYDNYGNLTAHSRIRYFVAENGDTLPMVVVAPVFCFAKTRFRSDNARRRYYEQYYKMIYNLKITYPYAQILRQRLMEIESHVAQLPTERQRKAYIKQVEQQLMAEFKPVARKMTISQGKMLIKLVNRQTGKTGYTILKELKGSINAFFWQAVARMFSQSLKSEFDPENDDKLLAELIFLYENGYL
jgi:hypothetical protein